VKIHRRSARDAKVAEDAKTKYNFLSADPLDSEADLKDGKEKI
jgi:hypothetical protein